MVSFKAQDSEANQPNREELLQLAIAAAKNGQKEGARVMFRQVLAEDKKNERALMWMAKLAGSKKERQQWLQRALNANPDNSTARDALAKMAYTEKASQNRMLLTLGVVLAIIIVLALAAFLLITLL
ncbi:MAG: hypothetical protein HXY40_14240 [Chloroflexi bacterium]|nr:hypothetical protein [Chloroflexota bacterium]